jgi:hypothetical protein
VEIGERARPIGFGTTIDLRKNCIAGRYAYDRQPRHQTNDSLPAPLALVEHELLSEPGGGLDGAE